MVRCINRMHEEIPGARAEGSVKLDEFDVYDPSVDVTAVRRVIGMVFQKPNPFPTMSIFDNVAAGLRLTGTRGVNVKERRPPVAAGGRPVGRGQGPAERAGHRPVRRPAAAAVHRPDDRRRAGGDPDGRAVLGARPGRDAEDRGADRRAQAALHDRDRHPQHAAGRSGRGHDGVHARRGADRARADEQDLHRRQATSGPSATSPASSGSRRLCKRPDTSSART